MHSELLTWTVRGAGLAVGIAIVAGLALLGRAAVSVLMLVLLAVLLASALEPVVGSIRGRLRIGRGPSILVVYASFFVVVVALAFVVVPAAYNQFTEIVANLPPLLDRARGWAADLRPGGLATSVTALIDTVERTFIPPPPDPDAVVEVGLTVAEAVISVGTLLTIVYFWLVEHARLQRFALAFLPAHRRAGARDAWNEIESRLGMWVRGQLVLMTTMGVATGIAYTLIGVPSALLLAVIAAVTEAVPMIGPLLGAIPAVLVASTVSPDLAVAVAAIYLVIQVVEANVLVPLVMRNTIGLSPFLVIVSLLVGGATGGIVGALFAVPVAASVLVVLERLQAREVPVAQDPGSVESVTPEEADELSHRLPDAIARKA